MLCLAAGGRRVGSRAPGGRAPSRASPGPASSGLVPAGELRERSGPPRTRGSPAPALVRSAGEPARAVRRSPGSLLQRHFLASGFILKHLQGRHMFSAFGLAPSSEPRARSSFLSYLFWGAVWCHTPCGAVSIRPGVC